jgi:hypothetical protein
MQVADPVPASPFWSCASWERVRAISVSFTS